MELAIGFIAVVVIGLIFICKIFDKAMIDGVNGAYRNGPPPGDTNDRNVYQTLLRAMHALHAGHFPRF
jgi:hypothetical protein